MLNKEEGKKIYNYDEILLQVNNDNVKNKSYLKSLVAALIKNNLATIKEQKVEVDFKVLNKNWKMIMQLKDFFDYSYNTKFELTQFFDYLLNSHNSTIIINAIFCPGYTENGYKDYIGKNNCNKLKRLIELKELLFKLNIRSKFNIILADIFLENTDYKININWKKELDNHKKLFITKATEYFNEEEIILLSHIFNDEKYVKGFINKSILNGKTYNTFYKNNINFYHKMNWNKEEIIFRNDKLYTVYMIVSDYIKTQKSGIYIPTETMYSRSKVITSNKVCAMYLYK